MATQRERIDLANAVAEALMAVPAARQHDERETLERLRSRRQRLGRGVSVLRVFFAMFGIRKF